MTVEEETATKLRLVQYNFTILLTLVTSAFIWPDTYHHKFFLNQLEGDRKLSQTANSVFQFHEGNLTFYLLPCQSRS
jgi:hypothetical protein